MVTLLEIRLSQINEKGVHVATTPPLFHFSEARIDQKMKKGGVVGYAEFSQLRYPWFHTNNAAVRLPRVDISSRLARLINVTS